MKKVTILSLCAALTILLAGCSKKTSLNELATTNASQQTLVQVTTAPVQASPTVSPSPVTTVDQDLTQLDTMLSSSSSSELNDTNLSDLSN